MAHNNPEHKKIYSKAYQQKNKIKIAARKKVKYQENKEKIQAKSRAYRKEHPVEVRETENRINRKYKTDALEAYGNKCTCCGETTKEFLCIDHVNNDGAEHRKMFKSGSQIFRWLKKNNYPSGFQVLCFNCNMAKAIYKICPHQVKETTNV